MKPSLPYVEVRAGDLALFKGTSILGKVIRWAQCTGSEAPSWANHVGVIVNDGQLKDAIIIESLWKTEKRPLLVNHRGDEISIFRFRMLTPEQKYGIVRKMREFVGDTYGWWRLIQHLVDNRIWGGRVVLRWIGKENQNRPICSYSAGLAYEFVDITFGKPAFSLQPDDMDDWCMNNDLPWQPVIIREKL